LPQRPLYDGIHTFPTGTILKADEKRSYSRLEYDVDLTEEEVLDIANERTALWIFGFIDYRDFLGQEHSIGFCHQWKKGNGQRFVELGRSPYQYRS
jgi:hypothetical protein